MTRGILENLYVMVALVPIMALAFWWFLRMLNWSTGTKIREVMEKIYSDPLAAAIYRGALVISVALLVINAFGRFV